MRNRLVHLCLATLLALFAAAVQIGLLAASAPAAPATIFNYPLGSPPCNTTLQACVSAANNPGDVVNVAAGTYITGQLVISHAITLQGAGPGTAGSSTVLRPDGSHSVISVTSGLAAGVVISGLTIMSGTSVAGGAGLFADAGTPLTLLNVDVLSNTITGPTSGGGVLASDAVTLTNVNFVNNRALNGAGGGLRAASTAFITGGRFERNASTNPGGALRVNGALTMIGVTVISNTNTVAGQDGGGVRADGGLVMLGGLVEANTTASNGGGLAVTTAAASISGTQIISNTGNEGGGVVASAGLNITNTLLDKNVARTGRGGAIFGNGNFTVTLAGTSSTSATTVSNSSAISHGAGLYGLGNVLLIGEVHFAANHSTGGEGGALYAQDVTDNSGNSVLLVVKFTGNSASGNGGAVRALGQLRLLNSPLFQNNSGSNGGAVYADGSVFLSRGTSSGNSAANGGAVYGLSSVFFNVHDTLNNTASGQGGCAFSATQITYNSADAIGCSAGTSGGAAFATLTVTLSANGVGVFHDNHANTSGGLAFANVVVMRDANVFSNTAGLQGGAVAANNRLDVSNSTVTSNTAGSAGGALLATGASAITSTLFANNRVTSTAGLGGAVWVTGTVAISNSTFLTNTAIGFNSNGGGLGASGDITIAGGAFQGNQGATGAGVRGLATVIAAGTVFTNNRTIDDRSGGGIAAATANVSGVTMTGNSACCAVGSGGAISASLAVIRDSVFLNNSAIDSGGAVVANSVFVTSSQFLSNTLFGIAAEGGALWTRGGAISGTTFLANSTDCCGGNAGGALFVSGTVFIHNSHFTGNTSDRGGAIVLQGNSSEIHDSSFDGNFVDCCAGGGAIDAAGLGPTIFNSTFTNNSVSCCDEGGAVRGGAFLDIESSQFTGNHNSSGDGGAVFIPTGLGGSSQISNSTFISNSTALQGGAVSAALLELINSNFISNTAQVGGGGLFVANGADVTGSTFDHNKVLNTTPCAGGGAVGSAAGASLSLLRSTFTNNAASCLESTFLSNVGTGGAVQADGSLQVARSRFSRNTAGAPGGGAIFMLPAASGSLSIQNSLFDDNTAKNSVFGAQGAALIISGTTTAQIVYNTWASSAPNNTSALAVFNGTVTLVDNIVAGHAVGVERQGGTVSEDFNLFFGNTTNLGGTVSSGGSSFTADPRFANPAGGDYHLSPGSAAIDRANDVGVAIDFDGDPRPLGPGFDIGFDEAQPGGKLFLPLIMR